MFVSVEAQNFEKYVKGIFWSEMKVSEHIKNLDEEEIKRFIVGLRVMNGGGLKDVVQEYFIEYFWTICQTDDNSKKENVMLFIKSEHQQLFVNICFWLGRQIGVKISQWPDYPVISEFGVLCPEGYWQEIFDWLCLFIEIFEYCEYGAILKQSYDMLIELFTNKRSGWCDFLISQEKCQFDNAKEIFCIFKKQKLKEEIKV